MNWKTHSAILRNTRTAGHRNYYLQKYGFELPKNAEITQPTEQEQRVTSRLISNALRQNIALWNEKPYEIINNKVVRK